MRSAADPGANPSFRGLVRGSTGRKRPMMSVFLRWSTGARRRLSDEGGVALFLALAVMLVITVMVTSVIAYTSSNSRDATLKRSGQSAYALAEAGVNQALAQLYSHYYSSSGSANNNSTMYSASWFTGTSSQQSPSSTAACTSTSSCMAWSVASWTPTGSSGINKGTLVLRGQGTAPNPTGGTALTRTVTETLQVLQPPTKVQTPTYWSGIYSGATGGTCDLTLAQGVTASAPIYVAGNLCVNGSASINGSGVTLRVLGNVTIQSGGSNIGGTSAVSSVKVGGGCVKGNGSPSSPCRINTAATQIWDLSGNSNAPIPAADPLPPIDWAGIQAQQAAATTSCTGGVSLTAATFVLTPNSSYSCTITDSTGVVLGSISYNAASKALTVLGDVYLSGSLSLSNTTAVTYTGIASLFVAGTITAANGSALCVHVSGSTCDFNNATNTSSSNYWDTTQSVLILQSQGAITAQQLSFQGGLYSSVLIDLGGGQSATQGPLVSPQTIKPGQQLNTSFPAFPLIYSGTLGAPPAPYQLTNVQSGSY
jgi:Tfp pilus assembly protein PilX